MDQRMLKPGDIFCQALPSIRENENIYEIEISPCKEPKSQSARTGTSYFVVGAARAKELNSSKAVL